MAGFDTTNTMPKIGHVTGLREQWLVRTDGALAHHLQDREISSHLYENRSRNQQIREDFPVALNEQRDLEYEARKKELSRARQAEIDAEIAREMAEINLRRQRRQYSAELLQQPSSSRAPPLALEPASARPASHASNPALALDINPEELGLSPQELEEIRKRLEQEERDARLARELSHEAEGEDALFADMKYAVEAQDSELARLLQEREYKKLQRAKEKARQKALLKKQQRIAAQKQNEPLPPEPNDPQSSTTLLDAYSNPRDMIQQNMRDQNGLRLCKSVESDLHYVEPFEKEQIQSKASALQAKEMSKQYYNMSNGSTSRSDTHHGSMDMLDNRNMPSMHSLAAMQHRQPPPPPTTGKKPRFPDPVSIRPASQYPMDTPSPSEPHIPHSYSENNNSYSSTYPPDFGPSSQTHTLEGRDPKRLSVISDITAEGLAKKKSKTEMQKKKKGCKIQ